MFLKKAPFEPLYADRRLLSEFLKQTPSLLFVIASVGALLSTWKKAIKHLLVAAELGDQKTRYEAGCWLPASVYSTEIDRAKALEYLTFLLRVVMRRLSMSWRICSIPVVVLKRRTSGMHYLSSVPVQSRAIRPHC